jgi:hypothetical protein
MLAAVAVTLMSEEVQLQQQVAMVEVKLLVLPQLVQLTQAVHRVQTLTAQVVQVLSFFVLLAHTQQVRQQVHQLAQ